MLPRDLPDDDLSGLFGGERREPVNRAPADYVPVTERIDEPCKACRSTGNFYSYSGKFVGRCFKCKGTGKVSFKTTREQREQGKTYRANSKAKAAEQFAADEPEVTKWIADATSGFGVKMRDVIGKYGRLTDNQVAACKRIMADDAAKLIERKAAVEQVKANAPTVSVNKLEEAFSKASARLQFPRLRVAGFTISHASADSKNAGALYIKATGGRYLGKMMDGKFLRSRECSDDEQSKIVEVANDPLGAAVAYGRLTGCCAICNRHLTNKESVERGIGPICAVSFGW